MTTLNHERPILKLIDDLKAEKSAREEFHRKKINRLAEKDHIHNEALKCLDHLVKHKNINVVSTFLADEKCKKHRELLRKWFAKYGPVKFSAAGEISYDRKGLFRLAEAREVPFWKFSEPKTMPTFDLLDELSRLVERADRRRLRPISGDSIDADALNEIRDILKKRAR